MILSKQLDASIKPTLVMVMSRLRTDSLLRNSAYVMATTALTAASGFLFWIIAARMYPAHVVGLASALIGTMMLAATLANVGIGPTLAQVLPRREPGEPWSLTLNAVLITGISTSLLAGSVAAIILPFLSPKLAVVGHQSGYALSLILGVPLLTLAAVLDATFTAERLAGNMLARAATFALLRIPLLLVPVLLGQEGALVICVAWILALAASLITGMLLFPRLGRAYRLVTRGIMAQARSMFSLVASHQLISLGALAPFYLLPVIVVTRLSLAENAYFYTSWQVGSIFFMVSPSVAVALMVEGSHAPEDIYHKARSSILIIVALLAPAMVVAFLGGRLILSMFGSDYALYGYSLLAILVVSAIPDAITNVYVAVLRVQKRLRRPALLNLGMATLTLVLAWNLLPRMGIAGAGWAWLIAQTTGSLVVVAHIIVVGFRSRAGAPQARNLARLRLASIEWAEHVGQTASAIVGAVRLKVSDITASIHHQRAEVAASQASQASKVSARVLLIVDPCSAGEALRIGPYVSMIRRHNPTAHITLVANADPLRALERVEDIDRFVESKLYIYRPYSRIRVRMSQVWRWLDLVRQVGTRYDLAITFYWGGVFQHSVAFVACRGRRVGFTQYPLMLSRVLLSRQLGPFKWKESHPPQHAALLRAAGIEAAEVARPYISYSDDDKATITQALQAHRLAGNGRLIVLHPGSDWACQQWLQGRWSELADALVTRFGATILFTGSAHETAYIKDIQRRMKAPSVSLTGRTTLPEMAALLSRSLLCICTDSAIFELTQATNTAAVVLAGPSRPDTGVFGARAPIVIRRMSDQLARKVSACQDGHNALNEPGCWNYRCSMAGLREISVVDVLHAVEEQIGPDVLGTPAEEEDVAAPKNVASVHPLLEATFSALSRENICWCVLRDETNLARPSDDVDLLVAPSDMQRVREVLKEHQYLALPTLGRGSHTFFVGYHPATESWVALDIVTELTFGPHLNIRTHAAEGVLVRRRQATTSLYVLAPDDGFWTLFLHCMLDKSYVASHRAARLQELAGAARTDSPLARLVALNCPSGWNVTRLVECISRSEWDVFTYLAPIFTAEWQRREPIRALWLALSNQVLQSLEIPLVRLQRPRVSVALLGPDGAGKSALTAEIQRSFYFPVRSVYMGLWKSGRTRTDSAVNRQIRGLWLARRGLEISGRLPKAWMRYLVAQYHRALGRMVIFDRYVYDALIAAHRSNGLPKWLYMWVLGHSCPAPDLVLVLDAPGEVMYARKGEESPEVLETQRQGLLALRGRVPHVQVVDATREEAAVRADILGRIWAEYCGRAPFDISTSVCSC